LVLFIYLIVYPVNYFSIEMRGITPVLLSFDGIPVYNYRFDLLFKEGIFHEAAKNVNLCFLSKG